MASTPKIQATLIDTSRGRRVVLTTRHRTEVQLTMAEAETLAADLVDIVETKPMTWADAEEQAGRTLCEDCGQVYTDKWALCGGCQARRDVRVTQ